MEAAALEESLQTFLADVLRVEAAPVARDVLLLADGTIDSMDLVRLAAHLEEALGIAIPDEDIHDENFGSVGRMLAYAASRRSV